MESIADSVYINNIDKVTNKISFVYINVPEYYITGKNSFIIECFSNIYLPSFSSIADDGNIIYLVNRSGTIVNLYTQNNELMYNLMHLPAMGGTSLYLNSNATAVLTCAMNIILSVNSWNLSVF